MRTAVAQPVTGADAEIRLTLLVGTYALTHVLGRGAMTEQVRAFRQHLPHYFALPHPSWRTTAWERRNPWFGADVLPALRAAVRNALNALPSRHNDSAPTS